MKIIQKSGDGAHGISLNLTSFVSFSANCPGPLNIALMVPEVRACSRFRTNSCPSLAMSLTYMASGPSVRPMSLLASSAV